MVWKSLGSASEEAWPILRSSSLAMSKRWNDRLRKVTGRFDPLLLKASGDHLLDVLFQIRLGQTGFDRDSLPIDVNADALLGVQPLRFIRIWGQDFQANAIRMFCRYVSGHFQGPIAAGSCES